MSSVKSTIKGFKDTSKTTIKTTKNTVKTAQQTAKTTQKTAQAAVKSAKAAEKAARATAKAAVQTTKAVSKAVIATVKAAIAAVQGLVSAIAAGGWVAVVIILIICMIALLLGSVFGIFFSGESNNVHGGQTMPAVVTELTAEFYNKVEDIKSENTYDVVDMDVMSINWPEVLAVYAVKVNTDPDNAMDVATLDDGKVEKIRGILNDMVSLSYSLNTEMQERTGTDADGNEITESVPITTLTITLIQKNVDEMAAQYGFSQTQKDQLRELLSPEYADLWAALLGGYVDGGNMTLTPDSSYVSKDMLSWPFGERYSITSTFGYRIDPIDGTTAYHGGIDISAPQNTPILAAADGTVIIANSTDAWGGGYGYHVKIQHDGGCATLYAHASKIAVVTGQKVRKDQVVAYVGTTGRSTGAHLHFEVWKNGVRTDPMAYFE